MKYWITGIALLAVILNAPANVVVQWGAPGGETRIVSEDVIDSKPTQASVTYAPGEIKSLSNQSYYLNAKNRSRDYNLSIQSVYGTHSVSDSNAGDYINIGKNNDGYEFVMMWENIQPSDEWLDTLAIEIRGSGKGFSGGMYRFLIENDDGWFTSEPTEFGKNYTTAASQRVSSLTWYEATIVQGGGILTGLVVVPDLKTVKSTGYHCQLSKQCGGKFQAANVRYFQAQTHPAPQTETVVATDDDEDDDEEAADLDLADDGAARIVVQWGEPDGAADIVEVNQELGEYIPISYTKGLENNPVTGEDYYPNHAGRSPIFSCADASELTLNTHIIKDYWEGDYIHIGRNCETVEAMIVWDDFLIEDATLDTFAINMWHTPKCMKGVHHFLIEKENGKWFASEGLPLQGHEQGLEQVVASELQWHEFSPAVNGVATVGKPVQFVSMKKVVSVGTFFHLEGGGSWQGIKMKCFQVTAAEKTAPYALIGLSALVLPLFLRKK